MSGYILRYCRVSGLGTGWRQPLASLHPTRPTWLYVSMKVSSTAACGSVIAPCRSPSLEAQLLLSSSDLLLSEAWLHAVCSVAQRLTAIPALLPYRPAQ